MAALVLWRDSAREAKAKGLPTRPSSPSPSDIEGPQDNEIGSITEPISASPPNDRLTAKQPPTSSSWVRWWRREQTFPSDISGIRPQLRESTSAPQSDVSLLVNDHAGHSKAAAIVREDFRNRFPSHSFQCIHANAVFVVSPGFFEEICQDTAFDFRSAGKP